MLFVESSRIENVSARLMKLRLIESRSRPLFEPVQTKTKILAEFNLSRTIQLLKILAKHKYVYSDIFSLATISKKYGIY